MQHLFIWPFIFLFCLNKQATQPSVPPETAKPVWGFHGHRLINQMAVNLLPPAMFGFYKQHIKYLKDQAVVPDARRYAIPEEAPRHYIDLDIYFHSMPDAIGQPWEIATLLYSEDSLRAAGIVPWHIVVMHQRLVAAFKRMDTKAILKLSAEIGHYVGDAHVPLHTTENYNGQLTGQHGIHGLWESRLPELFSGEYQFFYPQKANYLANLQHSTWQTVLTAHLALDSVFNLEKTLTQQLGEDKKYGFEQRNGLTVRVYSYKFSQAYHEALDGMVERQMRRAIGFLADVWYTAWADAGAPDLTALTQYRFTEEELQEMEEERKITLRRTTFHIRQHEGGPD